MIAKSLSNNAIWRFKVLKEFSLISLTLKITKTNKGSILFFALSSWSTTWSKAFLARSKSSSRSRNSRWNLNSLPTKSWRRLSYNLSSSEKDLQVHKHPSARPQFLLEQTSFFRLKWVSKIKEDRLFSRGNWCSKARMTTSLKPKPSREIGTQTVR